jgi:hypothetical protein
VQEEPAKNLPEQLADDDDSYNDDADGYYNHDALDRNRDALDHNHGALDDEHDADSHHDGGGCDGGHVRVFVPVPVDVPAQPRRGGHRAPGGGLLARVR